MANKLKFKGLSRSRSSQGQGITEYAGVITFVALLVAVVFGMSQGQLASALSQSFSSITVQLDRLARDSDQAGT